MTSDEQRWRDPHPGPQDAYDDDAVSGAHRAAGAARATARGMAATGRGLRGFGRYAVTQARRAADAQGADKSGLNRLLEMHAFNTAGDAAVAISLAGSLFFSASDAAAGASWSARGHVALFLGLTMVPFAVVAPLLGPLLDRFSHGRRWAIGITMAARAFFCWILAGALPHQSVMMYPAALLVLVLSKAYGVTRAAATPRLIPQGFTLVKTNGRVSMAGMVGVAVSAPIAGLCSLLGAAWVLRYATVLFVVATVLAIRLPAKVDHSEGEGTMTFRSDATQPADHGGGTLRVPQTVAYALRANCGPKFLSGFLLMFMAFLLQGPHHPLPTWNSTLVLGLVAGGAGAGNFLGTVLASLLRRVNPRLTLAVVLIAGSAVVLLTAVRANVLTLLALGLVAGGGAALAKFALDSSIQQDVPARVQTSAFARSDTTCQLAWVVGGFVGIALTPHQHLGLYVAFAVLTAWAIHVLSHRPRLEEVDERL
ncbi:MFS transporter [Nocardioides sp. BP30]|uniref:MFS transporter n=1 Tax=Nocardioides sp. BP30 TaxID=3036374 RepID=UPI002469907D|nr:MFS transporter [Nocardioides sp. BP30]WGL53177.1 MFS transporter [Nocardioides sp. BP30]